MSDGQSTASPAWHAYALLTITSICWGMNAMFGRAAVGEVSPLTLVMLRWVSVAVLVLLFTRRDLVQAWPVLRKHLPFVVIMGVLGYTAFNSFFYLAAHETTAVNIGILQGSIPVFVLIGAFFMYRTPVSPLQILGVLVTLAGVIVVTVQGDFERLASMAVNHGDLLMLIACAFYSSYTVGLKRRPPVPVMAMFAIMAIAAMIAAIPGVVVEVVQGSFQAPTLKGWVLVVLIALLPCFLAQICFMKGVEAIGPGRAGIFVNMVPIFAAISAIIFLGEVFQTFHMVALVLVLGGIWIAERGKAA